MKKYFSSKNRPVHLGTYPLETLERTDKMPDLSKVPAMEPISFIDKNSPLSFTNAMPKFIGLLNKMRDGSPAAEIAPIPTDPLARANNLKSWVYHEGLSMAGICEIPKEALLKEPFQGASAELAEMMKAMQEKMALKAGASANKMFGSSAGTNKTMYGDEKAPGQSEPAGAGPGSPVAGAAGGGPAPAGGPGGGPGGAGGPGGMPAGMPNGPIPYEPDITKQGHKYAMVILVEYTRDIKPGEPGYEYIHGTQAQRATCLAMETAVLVCGYLRVLGFSARAHSLIQSEVDLNVLTVAAGLGNLEKTANGYDVVVPYLGKRYAVAALTTNMEVTPDKPLSGRKTMKSHGLNYWLGLSGTKPGLKWGTPSDRPLHMGRFPMENLKRVDVPTTLIDEENVPRLPKRHDMFIRAAHGDLGPKPKGELEGLKGMIKEPYNHMTMRVIGGCVPLQYGEEAPEIAPGTDDPKKNADVIKALCTYNGADIVGICEAKDYMWYSHDMNGAPITPYHKNAIVVLADQGYDTMEGASGDDWITGSQGTKSYRRASLYTGMVAEQIRRMGYSARCHTVVDQDVLHIPMLLASGVGELSRIGETVLNPYLGPRFKSAVITTDMPLAYDKPIDFGLQDFCNSCFKCARECPSGAIPWGDKIMFNGYESWKQDPIKCTNYRLTNSAGCGCGRCMKTCPWNIEDVLSDVAFRQTAINFPSLRKWLAERDDKVNNGVRNPVKKWWFNVAWLDGKAIAPEKTNERDLRFDIKIDPAKQRLAIFPADMAPAPDEKGVVEVRGELQKEGIKRYKEAEKPSEYAKKMKERAR